MNNNDEHSGWVRVRGFLSGVLIGGLAGTSIALLAAPQSGKKTRALIRQKGDDLRDQVADKVDDARFQTEQAVRQGRRATRRVGARVGAKAQELQQRGQALIDEQKVRLGSTIEALQPAAKDTHS